MKILCSSHEGFDEMDNFSAYELQLIIIISFCHHANFMTQMYYEFRIKRTRVIFITHCFITKSKYDNHKEKFANFFYFRFFSMVIKFTLIG